MFNPHQQVLPQALIRQGVAKSASGASPGGSEDKSDDDESNNMSLVSEVDDNVDRDMSDNLDQIKEEISGLVKCDVIKEQVRRSVRAAVKDVAEGRIT